MTSEYYRKIFPVSVDSKSYLLLGDRIQRIRRVPSSIRRILKHLLLVPSEAFQFDQKHHSTYDANDLENDDDRRSRSHQVDHVADDLAHSVEASLLEWSAAFFQRSETGRRDPIFVELEPIGVAVETAALQLGENIKLNLTQSERFIWCADG